MLLLSLLIITLLSSTGTVMAADGDLKWTYVYDTTATSESSPAIALDGTIYLGGYWPYKIHAVNPNGTVKWYYPTAGDVYSSPAVADEKVYFGSYDKKLYCLKTIFN